MSQIDLQLFCGNDEVRTYINAPFRRGDFTYATNGHVLVRVPAIDGDALAGIDNPVSESALYHILTAHPDPIFAPLRIGLPEQTSKPCEVCGGTGVWKDDPAPGMYTTCDNCDGEKTINVITSVSVNGVHFDIKYIKLVAALPGAEFSINPIKSSMKSWRDFVPCPFRFDGGIGALSSMRSAGDLDLGNIEQWRTE